MNTEASAFRLGGKLYRVLFGLTLWLELLNTSDFLEHLISTGAHTFTVPVFRGFDRFLTPGIYAALSSLTQTAALLWTVTGSNPMEVLLFVFYSALRGLTFISWNNHYFLNQLVLIVFLTSESPQHAVHPLRLLHSLVYLCAGISKLSRGWLEGWVVHTLLAKHGPLLAGESALLVRKLFVHGGLWLDITAGVVLVVPRKFHPAIVHAVLCSLAVFHVTNLFWLFEAISFFPLHMLFSLQLWLTPHQGLSSPASLAPRLAFTHKLLLVIVALLAGRRFFAFPVAQANALAELTNEHHEFAWRMKSRVYDKLPIACAFRSPDDRNGSAGHGPADGVLSSAFAHVRDAETLYQELQHLKRGGLASTATASCDFWLRVNGSPFVLVVRPDANLLNWDLPVFYSGIPPEPVLMPPAIALTPSLWWTELLEIRGRLASRVGADFRIEEFAVHADMAVRIPRGALAVYCLGLFRVNGAVCDRDTSPMLLSRDGALDSTIHAEKEEAVFVAVFAGASD